MGKKNKKKQKDPVLLTESERRVVINDAVVKAYDLNITVTPEMWKIFNDYISTGKECKQDISIPNIERVMQIDLKNTKGKRSVINLRCNNFQEEELTRTQVEDINKFNKMADDLKGKGII
jgi:hypothetical protein